MKQFPAVFFLTASFFLQSCSLGFLDKESPTGDASSYTEYDSSSDILYCYDSEDNLKWIEYYDFNSLGQCIFVKHTLPSGTLLWSRVYEWSGSDLVTEAYYDGSSTLSWFNGFYYSPSRPVMVVKYSGSSALQSFMTWTYSGTSKVLSTENFDASSSLQWAYRYEYDGSDNRVKTSIYGSDSQRSASIDYVFDGNRRVIKATGYGSASYTGSYDAPCDIPGFPVYGGVNTTSRNKDNLGVPVKPTAPAVPSSNLTDSAVSHAWTKLWFFDTFGYTSATLNSSNLLVEMTRSAPEYLNGHLLETSLSYDGSQRLIRKTTKWNEETVLDLVFSYDTNGYLTSLSTSGRSLLLPLRYDIGYTMISGYKVPGELRIYSASTLLQRFAYTYGSVSSAGEYEKGISSITHTDGDGILVGTYSFSYADPDLRISVTDSNAVYTGQFVLSYDVSGNPVYFGSFDKDGNSLWNYRFQYEGGSRVSEAVNDSNNRPDSGDFFSAESLLIDLGRFLP